MQILASDSWLVTVKKLGFGYFVSSLYFSSALSPGEIYRGEPALEESVRGSG